MPTSPTKTALITGASSGFGLEFAKLFAADGYNIIITARPDTDLKNIAAELAATYKVKVHHFKLDLSEHLAAKKLHQWVSTQNLQVDFLINNAGIGNFGRFADNSFEREHELIELNVVALSELCHLFIPQMAKNGGGKILNVASIAAFQAGAYYATYFASKAYVLLFSEALGIEYAKDNITVTALCPGVSRTNFFKRAQMPESSWVLQSHLKDASFVAQAGYKAMMKGRRVITPGIRNKVVSKMYRVLPRHVLNHITKKIVEKAGRG